MAFADAEEHRRQIAIDELDVDRRIKQIALQRSNPRTRRLDIRRGRWSQVQPERLNGRRDAEPAQRRNQRQLQLSPRPEVCRLELQARNRSCALDERFDNGALAGPIRPHQRHEAASTISGRPRVASMHQMPRGIARLGAQRRPEQARSQAVRFPGIRLVLRDPRRRGLECRPQAERVEMIVEISPIERQRQELTDPLKRDRAQRPFPKKIVDDEMHELIFRREMKHPSDSTRRESMRCASM